MGSLALWKASTYLVEKEQHRDFVVVDFLPSLCTNIEWFPFMEVISASLLVNVSFQMPKTSTITCSAFMWCWIRDTGSLRHLCCYRPTYYACLSIGTRCLSIISDDNWHLCLGKVHMPLLSNQLMSKYTGRNRGQYSWGLGKINTYFFPPLETSWDLSFHYMYSFCYLFYWACLTAQCKMEC